MAPRAINYKAGSIIYFTGDSSDSVYLLKEGKVNLISNDLETGAEIIDVINTGEFFGVKSGLIKYPCEETARTVANSTVIEFTGNDFEALIAKNTTIILKMLKVFSNQLRRVQKQVQSIVGSKTSSNPSEDLFQIGNYYLKNKKYKQAITVYKRYLQYYPNGELKKYAAERYKLAEGALNSYGEGGGPTPVLEDVVGVNAKMSQAQLDDFINPQKTPISESDRKFTSEEERVYYKGVSLVSQNKYLEAINEFRKVIALGNDELKLWASFEIGKCQFLMGKYNECIQYLSEFIRKNPGFNQIADVFYYIGLSYVKVGNKQTALNFFERTLSSSNESEDINRKAKKAIKELS
jgi:TolA-binding protein